MSFGELLNQSVLVRGLIALIVFGVTGFSVANAKELPPEWWAIVGGTSTYFFSGIQAQQQTRAVIEAVNQVANQAANQAARR